MHASICLTNCRKSFFFSYLFRAWFYDSQFSKIKFSCSENIGDLPVAYLWWSAILLKLQPFIPQFNQFHRGCYYHITSLACSSEFTYNVTQGKPLYGKIPVFYALKYPKFTTITFYPPAWRTSPLLTSPNCTTSSWSYAHFNDIFTHVIITMKISGTNMKVIRVFRIRSSEKSWHFL